MISTLALAALAVVNVKTDHGALGDGTTDDTAAIEAGAIAAMLADDVLFFPEGTYAVAGVEGAHAVEISAFQDSMIRRLRMDGEGPSRSKIKLTCGGTQSLTMVRVTNGSAGLELSDMQFDASSCASTALEFLNTDAGITSTIYNSTFTGTLQRSAAAASALVRFDGVDGNVIVHSSNFTRADAGVFGSGSEQARGFHIDVACPTTHDNITVTGSYFSNINTPSGDDADAIFITSLCGAEPDPRDSSDFLVSDNFFQHYDTRGVKAQAFGTVSGNTFIRNPPGGSGTFEVDFQYHGGIVTDNTFTLKANPGAVTDFTVRGPTAPPSVFSGNRIAAFGVVAEEAVVFRVFDGFEGTMTVSNNQLIGSMGTWVTVTGFLTGVCNYVDMSNSTPGLTTVYINQGTSGGTYNYTIFNRNESVPLTIP